MAAGIRNILGWAGCVLFSVVALAGCGSSGGSGSEPVRTFGEIEAMGSIIVNGVKYETEGAQIVGLDHSAEDLKPGRVVLVDGRINDDGVTGRAESIKVEDSVKGPLVGPLLRDDGSVAVGTILGQTVIFEDNITKFDPGTGLPLGDDVNKVFVIGGLQRDDGKIQATFARKIFDDDFSNFTGIYEIKGVIAGLDEPTPGHFTIGALTVNYQTAAQRDLPPGGLADGLFVEVKGQNFNAETNILTATEIEGKARRMGDDHGRAKAEGFVSDLDLGNKTFTLNGQAVNYSGAAFRGGLEEDLIDGVKVQAQGPLSGGILNANRVTFKESVRIEAGIQNIQDGNLTFAGLPGIIIRVDPDLTRGAEVALSAGNEVKVRARQATSGLIATRLEKIGDGPADRTIIRGPVTAFDPATGIRTVTILDTVVVDTKTIENDDFKDHDRVIGPAVFFQTLQVGDIVKARFRSGANARWDQIEFQD